MYIRKSTLEDIPVLLEMFDYGKRVQYESGNFYQWNANYPNTDVLREDINCDQSYVCIDDRDGQHTIIGTFALQPGDNAAFHLSEDSQWLNTDDYVTIQRLCSNGQVKGTGKEMMYWIQAHFDNVRIYTHQANEIMLNLCQKTGFVNCGEFPLADQTRRIAFHYSVDEERD